MGLSIIAGIISGMISSLFLYIVMFRIKPRLLISKEICRDTSNESFRIKIVNLSHANLVDVKYTLHACYRSSDGIVDVGEIAPAKSKLEFIQKYSRDDSNFDYAVRLSYDLNRYISSDYMYFLFTFYAKHAVSGTATFIRKEFTREQIQCGRFETGKSTKILIEPCHHAFSECNQVCLRQFSSITTP